MSWFSDITQWAKSLEPKWEAIKATGGCFSDFAFSEMQRVQFHEGFVLQKEIQEILEMSLFPEQVNAHSQFGDPPITLFISKDGSFYLELYIWMETQTTIHQHSFEGAFSVLQGNSLECEYEFTRLSPIGPSFIGELHKKQIKHLYPGQMRQIRIGTQTIHKVIHLSKPTVSLILRTRSDKDSEIQYNYNFNLLASSGYPPEEIISRLRILTWFLNSGNTPTYKMIESLIPYSELWELLSQHSQGFLLLKKLSIIHSDKLLSQIAEQKLITNILHSLKTEEEKMLFISYEFCREKWIPWLESTKWCTTQNPHETLRLAILSTGITKEALGPSFLAALAADPV